ncbi:MAG: hypothetical protein RL670_707 [Actinomycetota bacterium]
MSTRDELLQRRYGRHPDEIRRRRITVYLVGGTLLAIFLAWSITVNFFSNPAVTVTTDGFKVLDASQSSIRFTVTSAPNQRAVCAIRAFNEGFQIVGYRTFYVAASSDSIRSVETKINTTEEPVSVSVEKCELK